MKRIVFLPGFLGQKTDFSLVESNLKKMGAQFELIALDFFSPDTPFRLLAEQTEFEDKLISYFSKWKIEYGEIYAVGYSFGGRLLSWLCEKHGSLFKNVAIISSFGGVLTESERVERLAADKVWADQFVNGDWAQVINRWNAQRVFSGSKEVERLENNYDRKLLGLAFTHYSPVQLGGIVASVIEKRGSLSEENQKFLRDQMLWICGERDDKYRSLYLKLQSEGVLRYREVKNAGHRVIFDQPYAVADILCHAWDLNH